jgi:hypothetical protein
MRHAFIPYSCGGQLAIVVHAPGGLSFDPGAFPGNTAMAFILSSRLLV